MASATLLVSGYANTHNKSLVGIASSAAMKARVVLVLQHPLLLFNCSIIIMLKSNDLESQITNVITREKIHILVTSQDQAESQDVKG